MPKTFSSLLLIPLLCALLAVSTRTPAVADPPRPREFTLNERMIERLGAPAGPSACEPRSVVSDLLRQIGPSAKVYPTENYYYFQFYQGGKSYSGSLRFTPGKREKGILEFACYETYASWLQFERGTDFFADLSEKDGVRLTAREHLAFELAVEGQTTTFSLNDVDQTPNGEILTADERFVGRILDESGLRFDLVYIPDRKSFFFALDTRTQVDETFVTVSPHVHLGRRTGFVFYEDEARKRHILIAVNSEETYKNSWLDGPFDQLPENYYETNGFWNYVYDAFPDLKGRLTANGTFLDNGTIFAMMPYRVYLSQAGLAFIKTCQESNADRTDLLVCLTNGHDK